MALYPKADLKLLAENATQAAITPRLTIMHTALDGMTTTSLKGWWDNPNSKELESHFYVQRTGGVEQYIDTQIRTDANVAANNFGVSVETWDGRAPDKPANPWNDAQVLAIIELNVWLCRTHGIPARLADRWDGSGIGYHNQFPEWSTRGGTSCPGAPRRDQLINVIIPAVAKAVNGTTQPEEEDMKSIIGWDPRQNQWYHLFGNQAVRITPEAAAFFKAIEVTDVGQIHPLWLEGCHISDGGGL